MSWGLLSDLLDMGFIEAFQQMPPKYLVSDALTWLDKIEKKVTGKRGSSVEVLAGRLVSH